MTIAMCLHKQGKKEEAEDGMRFASLLEGTVPDCHLIWQDMI